MEFCLSCFSATDYLYATTCAAATAPVTATCTAAVTACMLLLVRRLELL